MRAAQILLIHSFCVLGETRKQLILDDNPTKYVAESSFRKSNYQFQQRRDLKGRKGKSGNSGKKGKSSIKGKGKGYDSKAGGSDGAYYYDCYDCRAATEMPLHYVQPSCAPNPFADAPKYVPMSPWPTMTPFYSPQAIPSSITTVPPWYPIYFPSPTTVTGQTSMPATFTPPLPTVLPFPSIVTMIPLPYGITTPPPNPVIITVPPINANSPVPPWYPIYFSPYTTELPEKPSPFMPIVTLSPTTGMPQYIPPPPMPTEQPSFQTGAFPTSATTALPSIISSMISMPTEVQPVPQTNSGEPIAQSFPRSPLSTTTTTSTQPEQLPASAITALPSVISNTVSMPPEVQPVSNNNPQPIQSSFVPVVIPSASQVQPVPQSSTDEPIAQSFPRSPISTNTTTSTPQEQPLSVMPMSGLSLPSLIPQGSGAEGQASKPHSRPADVPLTFIPISVMTTRQPAKSVSNTQPNTTKKPATYGNSTQSSPTKPVVGSENVTSVQRGRDKGLSETASALTSSVVIKEVLSEVHIAPSEIPPQDYPRPSRQWDVVLK